MGLHRIHPALVAAACAGWAWDASAQESDAIAGVETELEALAEVGPQNLPGHPSSDGEAPEPEVASEAAPEGREWFGHEAWWTWSRATGDWGGARTTLEERGLSIAGSYTLDWSSVWSGGVANRASTRSLFDVNATADFEKMFGLEGGTAFIDFYSTDGRGGSADAGDFQSFSNIATGENVDQIAQLWYQQRLLDDRLRLKAGKIDVNSDFLLPAPATHFIHSAAAYSPSTGFVLPTYPNPATAVEAFVSPNDRLTVGAGVFDGSLAVDGVKTGGHGPEEFFSDDRSDDYFFIGQAAWTWSALGSLGNGRVAGGVWHHTGEFTGFDGGEEDGTEGFYALAEQRLFGDEDKPRAMDVFVQYGWSDEDVAPVNHHLGAGLVLWAPFEGRDTDATGVYVSHVDFTDSDGAGFTDDGETAIELFYTFMLTPAVALRPDIQFILDPSGDESIDDAVVGTLRISVSF